MWHMIQQPESPYLSAPSREVITVNFAECYSHKDIFVLILLVFYTDGFMSCEVCYAFMLEYHLITSQRFSACLVNNLNIYMLNRVDYHDIV